MYANSHIKKSSIYGTFFTLRKSERGYIALVSVLIISLVLLTLAVSVSLTGFYARSNILNSEIKEQSMALAESCVSKAVADVAIGNPTTGAVQFSTNPYTGDAYECTILSITPDSPNTGETTIETQGVFYDSYTNLVVTIDSDNQSVLEWREVPTLP